MTYRIVLGLALLLTSCSSTTQAERSTRATAHETDLHALEIRTFQLVNEYRSSKGLPNLTLNEKISSACRQHSSDMAWKRMPFGHEGFNERTDNLQIPYSSVAENVAWNYGTPDPAATAVKNWINSPGHRKNMEGKHTLTGMGVALNDKGAYYFTQIFLQPE